MLRRFGLLALLLVVAVMGSASGAGVGAQDATPSGSCVDPEPEIETPAQNEQASSGGSSSVAATAAAPAAGVPVDAATAARIVAGIENFVACRNAGEYAAYAALLTPNRMLAEAGTTNPADVVADLEAFNLPITILALGDVRAYPDGRFSAEFVHLFGPHLYYRSRLYVVEDGGVKFDEEEFLPEEPADDRSRVDIRLTDFAFDLGATTVANAQSVVLRGHNAGSYPHEIVVVRLPDRATIEQVLSGAIPEEEITFVGQVAIAPAATDDLVLVNLEPGTYTLVCFEAEPDGTPHAARGMVAEVTVEGTAAATP